MIMMRIRHIRRGFFFILSVVIFIGLIIRFFTGNNLLLQVVEYNNNIFTKSNNSQYSQQNLSIARAYAPGIYMAGQEPTNVSTCAWNYQLPTWLLFLSSQLISSPEIGEQSPYRILPFIIRGSIKSLNGKPLPKLTLCTHATADKVYHIVDIVKRWEGPVSLSIFAPGNDARLAVTLLERACHCEPGMYKVCTLLV